VQHVFHSRKISYEKDIRTALNGGGVDVVLNSLTSEGFKEASLAVCNDGARFVEMSKLNIYLDTRRGQGFTPRRPLHNSRPFCIHKM
jgi:NADPH:quinone reductase-like Zn-dependent oxidoreductase